MERVCERGTSASGTGIVAIAEAGSGRRGEGWNRKEKECGDAVGVKRGNQSMGLLMGWICQVVQSGAVERWAVLVVVEVVIVDFFCIFVVVVVQVL